MASGISSIPRQELGRGRNRGHVRSSLSSQAPAWRHRQRGQVEEKRKEEQKEKRARVLGQPRQILEFWNLSNNYEYSTYARTVVHRGGKMSSKKGRTAQNKRYGTCRPSFRTEAFLLPCTVWLKRDDVLHPGSFHQVSSFSFLFLFPTSRLGRESK